MKPGLRCPLFAKGNGTVDRLAILVLGMHRSGTSALTRSIALAGAELPRDLMPPTADNPLGYWESRSIARFNSRLLESAGTRWNDDAPVPAEWIADPARAADRTTAAELLAAEFGTASTIVFKDPRLCRLLPFWKPVLAEAGFRAHAILAIRDPWEVALSLQVRVREEAFRPAAIAATSRGLLLWLRYVLDAERESRDLARTTIEYASLVSDWRQALGPLLAMLPLAAPSDASSAAIDAFLSPNLRHQRPVASAGACDGPEEIPGLETLRGVQAAIRSRPDEAQTAFELDALTTAFERLRAAYAGLRQGLAASDSTDPWGGEILAGLARLTRAGPAARRQRAQPSVLLLSAAPSSAGHVYRVVHTTEALAASGWRARWLPLEDPQAAAAVQDADVVTVFRGIWGPALEGVQAVCRARGIPLVHDIDDLVFDEGLMEAGHIAFIDRLPAEQRQRWLATAVLHRQALAHSDAAVVTTAALAAASAAVVPHVYILPNGIDSVMLAAATAASRLPKPSVADGRLRIGFASGTPTHDRDFGTIAEVLADLLARRPELLLVIVGHLAPTAFPALVPHRERIIVRPRVSLNDLHAEVAAFDVNLAPLEVGNPFCEAKSPIRCTTAALVGVPSVVAATGPLIDWGIPGVTGLVAHDAGEWTAAIERLLDDAAFRATLGEAARLHALARFGPESQRELAARVYAGIVSRPPR